MRDLVKIRQEAEARVNKPTFKETSGGGFEFGGVQFTKEGQPVAVTSKEGETLLKKAIGDNTRAVNEANALIEQENLRIASQTKPGKQPADVFGTPSGEVAGLLRLQSRINLNEARKPLADLSALKTPVRKAVDVVTLGGVQRAEIQQKENQLYNQIEQFNKRFGNKELSPGEYDKAKLQENYLKNQLEEFKRLRGGFEGSRLGEVYRVIFPTSEFNLRREARRENNPENIARLKRQLLEAQNKFNQDKSLSNRRRLEGVQYELNRVRGERPIQIIAGQPPFIDIPFNPQAVNSLQLVGRQYKAGGNKIVTDLLFTTESGEVGIARGVTLTKNNRGVTLFVGKSQPKSFNKLLDSQEGLKTLYGASKNISKRQAFKLRQLLAFNSKEGYLYEDLALLTRTKTGQRIGEISKVGAYKGQYYRRPILKPTGGLGYYRVPKITDEVKGVSDVISRKDISFILGASKGYKSGLTKYVGVIKRIIKGDTSGIQIANDGRIIINGAKLGLKQTQQFNKALKDTTKLLSGSIAQTEKTGLSQAGKTILASTSLISLANKKPLTIKEKQKVVNIIKSRGNSIKTSSGIKSLVRVLQTQIIEKKVKNRVRQQQIKRSLEDTLTKQISRTVQRSRQDQRSRQRLRQALQQKQINKRVTRGQALGFPKIPRFPIIPLIKSQRAKKRFLKGKKGQLGYNVFAKVKGRFVKINKTPLNRLDALSRGAYAVDNTTARGYKIVALGRVKNLGGIKPEEKGYFFNTLRKYRPYRIRKGRKKSLINAYIERKRYGIDTRGEKRGLSIAKLYSRKVFKRRPIRKLKRKKSYSIFDF